VCHHPDGRARRRRHAVPCAERPDATAVKIEVLQCAGPEQHAKARLEEDPVDEAAILDKIKEVVADKLDADPADVIDTASFVDDLGADSLDVVELIMGLEDEFGIEISDEEAEGIRTVGDAVRFIAARN
jgi:acyl carrier protein